MGSNTDNTHQNSTTPQQTTGTEPEPIVPDVTSPIYSANSSSASVPTLMAAVPESPTTEKKDDVESAPQPAMGNVNGSAGCQLSATDALSYIDAIKVQFHDRPDCYNHFLDIMRDFKRQE